MLLLLLLLYMHCFSPCRQVIIVVISSSSNNSNDSSHFARFLINRNRKSRQKNYWIMLLFVKISRIKPLLTRSHHTSANHLDHHQPVFHKMCQPWVSKFTFTSTNISLFFLYLYIFIHLSRLWFPTVYGK